MTPEVGIFAGALLCSAALSYAWWVWFRVWRLRQDLFMIRDEAWDAMRRDGTLDDPSHREFRDAVNVFIRVAPWLSVFTVLRILAESNARPVEDAHRNQLAYIEIAEGKAIKRISRYLFRETILGVSLSYGGFLYCALLLEPMKLLRQWQVRWVNLVYRSETIQAAGRLVTAL